MSLIHRLTGHDYGGQAVQILDHVLYSGSKVLLTLQRLRQRQAVQIQRQRDIDR